MAKHITQKSYGVEEIVNVLTEQQEKYKSEYMVLFIMVNGEPKFHICYADEMVRYWETVIGRGTLKTLSKKVKKYIQKNYQK